MAVKPTHTGLPVPPSSGGTSGASPAPDKTQLSPDDGVQTNVSSMAMDRGLLAAAAGNPPASAAALAGEVTDADIMLRVKGGDDSAFQYLVEKYRRPMVSFMYRMAHNAA